MAPVKKVLSRVTHFMIPIIPKSTLGEGQFGIYDHGRKIQIGVP
jgi:hypothetical protein